MEEPGLLDFIAASAALRAQYGRAPTYANLWNAAASGLIPATRTGRFWRIAVADLPAVASYFGLTPDPTAPPAPTPRTPDKPQHAA
jgi:hypothetical protein